VENWFLGAGIAISLFCLWAILRLDWPRLTRPSLRVQARVIRHRISWENSAKSYAAIYAFTAESEDHEVEDALHRSFPIPELGTIVELSYPAGRPDLARPPRPLLWGLVYLLLLGMLGILTAKALGWLDG
jgi:hypothetical protein